MRPKLKMKETSVRQLNLIKRGKYLVCSNLDRATLEYQAKLYMYKWQYGLWIFQTESKQIRKVVASESTYSKEIIQF